MSKGQDGIADWRPGGAAVSLVLQIIMEISTMLAVLLGLMNCSVWKDDAGHEFGRRLLDSEIRGFTKVKRQFIPGVRSYAVRFCSIDTDLVGLTHPKTM